MQPVRVAQSPGRAWRWTQSTFLIEAIEQVLDNRAGLGDGLRTVGDHWRLAQWMDRAQLRRCQHAGGVALVALYFVVNTQLLEQPEYALRTRVIEMMNCEHGRPPTEADSMTRPPTSSRGFQAAVGGAAASLSSDSAADSRVLLSLMFNRSSLAESAFLTASSYEIAPSL